MSTPLTRVLVIKHSQGLHARPAQMIAKLAYQYKCRLEVIYYERRVDARSPIELLTLGVHPGEQITLEAEGDDAEAALAALTELVEADFPIEESDPEQKKAGGKS